MLNVRKVTRLLPVLAALLGASLAHGLDPKKALTQYQQDFWTEADGLPQASVQTITQTRNGYLWIGTRDGLARFDGTKFTIYRGDEHPGLLSDDIRSLYEDRQGRLWVGTFNGGVSCFQDDSFRPYNTREGALSGVLEIYQDAAGDVWFGSWKGIGRLGEGNLQVFTEDSGLKGGAGWGIWEASDGRLWAATERSLHIFKDGRFYPTNYPGSRAWDIREALVDQRTVTWLGTLGGLLRIENGVSRRLRTRDGLPDSRVRALAEDGDGNLWVGTWSGLARVQGTNVVKFEGGSEEWFNGMVEALFVDRDGSLWVGVRGGGLGRLRDARFTNLTAREGLPSNHPRSVFRARDGAVWIATDGGGLARVQEGKVEKVGREAGLPSDFAVSVAEDRHGVIWAGLGRPAAVAAIQDGKVVKVLGEREGLGLDYSVRALLVDRDGVLWAGGDGGLRQFVSGRFREVPGVPGRPVRTIAQDREGSIWVAGGEGLCVLTNGSVAKVFTVENGLSHNAVYSIYEDAQGSLWLGTQQGLSRYAAGQVKALRRSQGGFQGAIYHVTEDDRGQLWMSSSRGISSINKARLEAVLERREGSVETVTFGLQDGLKSTQGQGGSQSPGCKTADGRLWFAMLNGIGIVSPKESASAQEPPQVLLEHLWADRAVYRPEETNIFAPGTDDFEFHYTALLFITPERARFRYQLLGHDKEWVDAKSRRTAYYSNLRPGQFTFQVSASRDGVNWSEPVRSAPFTLRPHFYQTSAFYAGCAAGALLLGWVFHRRRLALAEERFALVLGERTRIARDLHDTLAQGFAGTAFQLEALRSHLASAPPPIKRHLELALTMVRHSFGEAKRAVMNLRSATLESEGLLEAVRQMAEQIIADTGVELALRARGKARRLGPDVENELLRICQEALANAIKHSHATRIEIAFEYLPERVNISISDNGVGFDPDAAAVQNGRHFGLQGMQERVKQIGGSLRIESARGSGARVVISSV